MTRRRRITEDATIIPGLGKCPEIISRHWGSSDVEADEPRIETIITEPQSMKQSQPTSQQQSQLAATAPIPNDIEQARHDAGLDLAQAAVRCRLAAKTIRQIERGTHPLSLMTIAKMARGYGCPTGRLLCAAKFNPKRIRKGRPAAALNAQSRA